LALRLAQQGFKVTILEASDRLGGLAAPAKIGPYTWDQFYHVILMSDSNTLDLLKELDLTDQINWRTAKTGFFTDGSLYSMSNVFEFLTFPPLDLIDKFRLGWTIFYASRIKSWERLEEIKVTDWLVSHSGRRTFEKIWLPLLKSKLGDNYNLANAAFIWATIDRMYAARRSGIKQEMFGYADGGYAQVLDRFESRLDDLGINSFCDTDVYKIKNNGTRVELTTQTDNDLQFDNVILTIPTSQIQALCPKLTESENERLSNVKYGRVICLALIVKNSLAEYYITNITDDWVPFTAVIEMTSLVDNGNFDGNRLIYLPLYLDQEDMFWNKNDEDVEYDFLKALESMYPSFTRKDVLFSKISRASHVLPITTLNYTAEALPPTETSLENIFVVNSAQIANGTMNVNEIIGLANRKAKEIASYLEA